VKFTVRLSIKNNHRRIDIKVLKVETPTFGSISERKSFLSMFVALGYSQHIGYLDWGWLVCA